MTNTPTEPIPTDREAMQQALEALEEATTFTGAWPDGRKAITALRAALAQPQQEAVFIQSDHLQKARQAPFLCRVEPTQRLPDFVPLYDHRPASPAPWRDLTTSEIAALWAPYAGAPPFAFALKLRAALRAKNAAPASPEPKE